MPVVAWALVALLVGAVVRFLVRLRVRGLPVAQGRGVRRWVRSLLPGAVFLAVGVGLLLSPLGLVRHSYPDGGWALTVIAYVALGGRLLLAASALRARQPRRTPPPEACSARPRAGERRPASFVGR